MIGIVGAIIITRWAYGLVKQTGPTLLDASIDEKYQSRIIAALEADADNRICDIHIWKISATHYAAIISLMTHTPQLMEHYKALLSDFHRLSHVTIEINTCTDENCSG